jgi:serine phosphatase RsbU (regulator of sigma subunit)
VPDNSNISEVRFRKLFPDRNKYRKLFINPVAEGLYNRIRNSDFLINPSDYSGKEFRELSQAEKSFWHGYAEAIPLKYSKMDLFIRPFENFCRTCIITDDEVVILATMDKDILASHRIMQGKVKDRDQFLTGLNYFVPAELKKLGYEIVRHEEMLGINYTFVRKLAKAIHSRYLHEIRSKTKKSELKNHIDPYHADFDELHDDIKNSNIDNAAHIPTKLLSIGYNIRQVKKGFRPFALHLNKAEIETMARVEHLRWSWEKRLNGWMYGPVKDEKKKTHPSLVSYDHLSEVEKEKDRELVRLIPAFLKDINYEASPLSPNKIKKLSYALKPQGSIHRILEETRELNEQLRTMVKLTPDIEEIIGIRNKKIEEAIKEVEGSYNYAQHIQQTFLPDDFYIRENFPDSFILFKPKDIVSGDFYFFSRQSDEIFFAVADCTGHGIPGAMLSTLGYGILDQAVNEIGLTDPAEILHHLYSKIHRYLRRDSESTGISDDMDIALCVLNIKTNVLIYAGVKNPLYLIRKKELFEYPAQNNTNRCEEGDCNFKSTKIQVRNSDIVYLFSDGFADQFGGKKHKRYQSARFRNYLKNIHVCSMPEQSDKLYAEIEKWREENNEDQTDDILVLGVRL